MAVEARTRPTIRRHRTEDHRLPLPTRHKQMEQDRTPALLSHYRQLAWPAAGELPNRRQPYRQHHNLDRPRRRMRARPEHLPDKDQAHQAAEERDTHQTTRVPRGMELYHPTAMRTGCFIPAPYESPVDRDTLNAYQRTLREALSSTLPEFDIRTELRSEGPYRAVTVTLLDSTSRPERANLVSRHAVLDVDQIVRDDRAGKTGTTGIVAQPAGFFVDEDTIYIVKTADIDRWSYGAALDDAGRILAALAFGD